MRSPAATVSGLGKLLSGGVTDSPTLLLFPHTIDAAKKPAMLAMTTSVFMTLTIVIDTAQRVLAVGHSVGATCECFLLGLAYLELDFLFQHCESLGRNPAPREPLLEHGDWLAPSPQAEELRVERAASLL